MLRDIFSGGGKGGPAPLPPSDDLPNERLIRQGRVHARAPMARHLEIALGDLRIGDQDVLALLQRCVIESGSRIPPLKALRRPLASYFLARYFLYAMDLGGSFAECGVFRGTSALFLCHAARARRPGYSGEGWHLVDSFEGVSQPSGLDAFEERGRDGTVVQATVPQGSLSAPIEAARDTLRDFPAASLHRGWIPAVFQTLPGTQWAFVHVDVDLYEPTRDCLTYFYPRLLPGGVIVCDDYGTTLFPGARRAWDRFCDENDQSYVVLDTGQSVILKG